MQNTVKSMSQIPDKDEPSEGGIYVTKDKEFFILGRITKPRGELGYVLISLADGNRWSGISDTAEEAVAKFDGVPFHGTVEITTT